MVLGTFGYMAPEQVRGLAVDHRADMFAFGAVLYEMLSGERAFKGETAADTMTAILTKDPPDLDTARLAISPGLDRIVRRCLEKTPELRFQSANDLAFALETLSTGSTSSSTATSAVAAAERSRAAAPRSAWLPWAVAALARARRGSARGCSATRRRPSRERAGTAFTRISEAAGEETSPSAVAGWHDGRVRGARERQLGHLLPARRRPQRDADRQRSAARRGRRRRSRPTDR